MNTIPIIQRVVAILWPAFMMAVIATVFLATVFDPAVIFIEYDVSELGFYSISFFLFWFFGVLTAAATCFFLKPCQAIKKANELAAAAAENSTPSDSVKQ